MGRIGWPGKRLDILLHHTQVRELDNLKRMACHKFGGIFDEVLEYFSQPRAVTGHARQIRRDVDGHSSGVNSGVQRFNGLPGQSDKINFLGWIQEAPDP